MDYIHGGDIYTNPGMIDFSANINPLGASREVIRAARDAVSEITAYPDSRCRKLRIALAGQLDIRPEHLIFGNGAAELIFLLTMALKPHKALLTAPSFAEYKQALQTVDCEILYCPLQETKGFTLDEQYFKYLIPDLDLIFLCSPSNPVGNVIEHQLLLRILNYCQAHQIRMVVDECFYEFLDAWQEHTLQFETEQYPELFILRAFTKMHAMPGLRLGYGLCQDIGLIERMELLRQPWSVSTVAQAAGYAAVCDTNHVTRTRDFIRQERDWLLAGLDRIGVTYYKPTANFIFFKSSYPLYEMLKDDQILIRDCSNYDGLTKGYYRIAIRRRAENERLLGALEVIYQTPQSDPSP